MILLAPTGTPSPLFAHAVPGASKGSALHSVTVPVAPTFEIDPAASATKSGSWALARTVPFFSTDRTG